MSTGEFDVAGIGNAIVDVLSQADESMLERLGLPKGMMTLIDEDTAHALYGEMGPSVEMSGGSAANTIAGIAALGGRCAYIGKVSDDLLGTIFQHDLSAQGVSFQTAPAADGPSTARCLILVTPDGQRTMQTYLGACVGLGPDDVDPAVIESAKITYLEGYLWDPPQAKEAFRKAATLAHAAGRKVALSLSDPFCVARHKDELLALLAEHVDILFANEAEITGLYGCGFDRAVAQVRGHCDIAALTRGAHGSVAVAGDTTVSVPAEKIERVVDTTGAGDLYAAGFLFALTRGRDLSDCARLGGICAAEAISHFGARPETDLRALARSAGLLDMKA
jgi:sugar/nucleoside kinase (ribokinase family)